MKPISTLLVVTAFVLAACRGNETKSGTTASAPPAPGTASAAAAEKTYPMTATIVSRDPVKNMVNLDNQEVPGEMGAMKMDYELRGAKVDSLPPDGKAVEVTVHDQNGKYWVTDVKPKP